MRDEIEFGKLKNLAEFMYNNEWYFKAGDEAVSELTGDHFKPKRDLVVLIDKMDSVYYEYST